MPMAIYQKQHSAAGSGLPHSRGPRSIFPVLFAYNSIRCVNICIESYRDRCSAGACNEFTVLSAVVSVDEAFGWNLISSHFQQSDNQFPIMPLSCLKRPLILPGMNTPLCTMLQMSPWKYVSLRCWSAHSPYTIFDCALIC